MRLQDLAPKPSQICHNSGSSGAPSLSSAMGQSDSHSGDRVSFDSDGGDGLEATEENFRDFWLRLVHFQC